MSLNTKINIFKLVQGNDEPYIEEKIDYNIPKKNIKGIYIDNDTLTFSNIYFNVLILQNNKIIISNENKDIKVINFNSICKYSGKFIKFFNCIFTNKIEFFDSLDFNYQFNTCNMSQVYFTNLKNKNNVYDISLEMCSLSDIQITDCTFTGKFYINCQKKVPHTQSINSLNIKETKFLENFKLHNCTIDEICLDNIDFYKNADFFKSVFNNNKKPLKRDYLLFEDDMEKNRIYYNEVYVNAVNKKFENTEVKDMRILLSGINFHGLVIFEECVFSQYLVLEYVTFFSLVQFRGATFTHGINLERINTEKEMNFFNVKGLKEVDPNLNRTSKETYRILKHNSQRIGNMLDANIYHSLELLREKETLDKEVNFNIIIKRFFNYFSINKKEKTRENEDILNRKILSWIILKINWKTSRFTTNWLIALKYIVYLSFITVLLLHYDKFSIILDKRTLINFKLLFSIEFLEYVQKLFNKVFQYMSILYSGEDLKNNGFTFLINKVGLGYLYYQFIISVRKDTRK